MKSSTFDRSPLRALGSQLVIALDANGDLVRQAVLNLTGIPMSAARAAAADDIAATTAEAGKPGVPQVAREVSLATSEPPPFQPQKLPPSHASASRGSEDGHRAPYRDNRMRPAERPADRPADRPAERPADLVPRDLRDARDARDAGAAFGGGDHRTDPRNVGAKRPLPHTQAETARASWGSWRNGPPGAAAQRGSGAAGVVEGACSNPDYERRLEVNSGSTCLNTSVAQSAEGANRTAPMPPQKMALHPYDKRRPEPPKGGVPVGGPAPVPLPVQHARGSLRATSADVHLKIVARAAPVAAPPRASAITKHHHVFVPARQPPWTGRIVVQRRRLRLRWLGDVGERHKLSKARCFLAQFSVPAPFACSSSGPPFIRRPTYPPDVFGLSPRHAQGLLSASPELSNADQYEGWSNAILSH